MIGSRKRAPLSRPRAKAGRFAKAVVRLRRAIRGASAQTPRESDALREQFDRDYDALLHEMAVPLAHPRAALSTRKRGA
jgi:hypothetical protein